MKTTLIFLCHRFPDKNVLTPVKWNSLDSEDDNETSAARDESDELILTQLTPGLVRFKTCTNRHLTCILCAQDNMQAHENHGGIHAAQVTTIWTKTTKMTKASRKRPGILLEIILSSQVPKRLQWAGQLQPPTILRRMPSTTPSWKTIQLVSGWLLKYMMSTMAAIWLSGRVGQARHFGIGNLPRD